MLDSLKERTGSDDPAAYYQLETREVFFMQPTETADFGKYYPGGVPPLPNPAGWELGEWGVGQTAGSKPHFVHIESPMLEPEVPWENIEAYMEAVEEYGMRS